MSSTSTVVLAAGYVLAVPFTVFTPGFLRLWRRREPAVFAVEQIGAALVVTGWLLKDNQGAAAFNAAWLLGLSVMYGLEGRKRARATA